MAASRSASRSRRSARKSPRGRKLSNRPRAVAARQRRAEHQLALAARRDKKNEGRASSEWLGARGEGEDMDVSSPDRYEGPIRTRSSGAHDHHIASDGSRQPGLNPNPDAALEKKLAELRSLVDRMERIASSTSGRAALAIREQAECEMPLLPRTRGRAVNLGECDDAAPVHRMTISTEAPKDRGAIDSAGGRVRRLTNLVENIRAIVASKAETLLGPSPAAEGGSKSAGERSSPSADVHALFTNLDQLDNQVERLEHEVVSLLSQL